MADRTSPADVMEVSGHDGPEEEAVDLPDDFENILLHRYSPCPSLFHEALTRGPELE